ncbi:MAG: hypothetical protein SCARUB_02579 [Candidatus Scalindua rubra]|uniref:HEAT repeat protein n=1 Tax=Candidatus Scalindua rubra TaxID=1872076 RepID=A0A1E3X9H7_9BACT|nr:MAG: hypothetical protein SCARUB_02579 [Candidatus Scalindua rubra]
MGKAEGEAISALWHVIYNDKCTYSKEQRIEAIRSLGAYLSNEEATGHLHSVIHDANKYPDDLRMAAIQVLGKR